VTSRTSYIPTSKTCATDPTSDSAAERTPFGERGARCTGRRERAISGGPALPGRPEGGSAFDRTHGQSGDHASLDEEEENHHRDGQQGGGGHDRPPLDGHGTEVVLQGDRQRVRAGVALQEREGDQELV